MTAYYEEIMELWKAGDFSEAISFFSEWLSKDSLAESFGKELSNFWRLIEVECEENPGVMFSLYEMLKKVRNWDDKTLCKKLIISEKAVQEIKRGHKPRSKGLGLKMLYALFPQMGA